MFKKNIQERFYNAQYLSFTFSLKVTSSYIRRARPYIECNINTILIFYIVHKYITQRYYKNITATEENFRALNLHYIYLTLKTLF